jgi:hypothetical protein
LVVAHGFGALWLMACVLSVGLAKGEQAPGQNAATGARTNRHWSLRPLQRQALPTARKTEWVRTGVDAFILSGLEGHGLSPNPPADKRTLLRRVSFDLTGLPPTPEELRDFLADNSPDAYEKVVERLLGSPRYGERWARHWLDAVHFAETHGHDQDRIRTNAWPYRDYVIRAFNEDKPYGRMVEEQLAGDALYPEDPQATLALGFIAAGPWDESSLRDIREDTLDRQIGRYLDRDDMVAATMSTFASATVHCARCHEHKFDPISQEDYYSLQAVFAGVDRAERAVDLEPKVHRTRQELLKRKRALESGEPAIRESLLTPAVEQELAPLLQSAAREAEQWSPATPSSAVASNGSVLTLQSDGTILASGPRPEKDTYVISVRVKPAQLTAVRLEVLTDDSLPHRGPGRQDNGNLHLSEFQVRAGTNAAALRLQKARADFDQDGWTSAHAIDGKEKTAWGVYPRVGQSHSAVFEFAPEATRELSEASALTFILEQQHGGGHLIGRLRFAVTSAAHPISTLPEDVAALLRLPESQRTREQRQQLAVFFLKTKTERELAALGPAQLVYAGASDFVPDGGLIPAKAPRKVHVLKRGDINRPGEEAGPGALSAVGELPSRFALAQPALESTRRAALAHWLSAPANPLTWRSIVNRVWRLHFGTGIVETPNDFGRMGEAPSHPELLDWLARWFLEHGGSFKQLHRLLVTSAVYRQSSAFREGPARLDAENRRWWRMNRTRLDAESVHDTLLQLTGELDLRMGGPSDRQFALSPGVHVTPVVDYAKFDFDSAPARRRSVYRFLFRTLPDPFMDSFDCPEGSQLTPARGTSVTALQALALLNHPFAIRQSERLAARVRQGHVQLAAQVQAACELSLGRSPSEDEAREFLDYATRHGLANLCRLFINSNEFIFIN